MVAQQLYGYTATIRYGVGLIDNPVPMRLEFGGGHTLLVDEAVWRRCIQVGSWRLLGQALSKEDKQAIGWANRGRMADVVIVPEEG